MTGSADNNIDSVAQEVNQMEVEYGKNFKILRPNDQIRGNIRSTFSYELNFHFHHVKKYFQNFKLYYVIKTQREVILNFMLID